MTKDAARTAEPGYALTRFNAVRHGVLSRYTVLPWEDEAEYTAVLDALMAEHLPQGPTEAHLVEELAGIIWRKRRLRLAEQAAFRRGLKQTTSSYRETAQHALVLEGTKAPSEAVAEAIRGSETEAARELADLDQDEAQTRQAIEIARSGGKGAYAEALAALREDTRDWWQEALEEAAATEPDDDEEPYKPNAKSLLRFLESELPPWYEERRAEIRNRPTIREQAFGEALDPDHLGGLARYEVHLDRKLERTLAMLLRLKELRRLADPPG